MANETLKDIYILHVDTVCSVCGAHNKGIEVLDYQIQIVACAECGHYLMLPEGMEKVAKEVLDEVVTKFIQEGPDAVL